MFFTPFAFVQQPFAVQVSAFTGYYIGGLFTAYASNARPSFRMLDSSGSISSSYNIGNGVNDYVTTIATQSDGKILVGGAFSTYSGSTSPRLVRINTNGTRDTTFNVGSAGVNNTPYGIVVQSDGKVVFAGSFNSYSGSGVNLIARANTNGTLDNTYTPGAGFNSTVYSLELQSDQKIIAAGNFTTYSGSTKNYIARINTNGTSDTGSSWNTGVGFGALTYATALVPSNQKIIVGGNFTTYSGSSQLRIVRLNTDGTRDTTFNPGTAGANGPIYTVATQTNDKILAGGAFTAYSGSTANSIVRINTDGTLDTSFNTGVGFDTAVYNIAVQFDGKVLVQGIFNAYSGSVARGVIRLNSDGTVDNTFNRNFSINSTAISGKPMVQLSNGSIALGGSYTGDKVGYVATLGSAGNTNAQSIISSQGISNNVYTVVRQSNGKIILGGNFNFYSGSSIGYMLSLESDGTRTPTGSLWNPGTGFNSTVNSMTTQSDGKIVAGGGFTTYSGSGATRIARINTNGTIDTTFNIGTGINNTTNALAVQADGKIVAAGQFTTYSGSNKNRIVRINTNGTSDTGSSWNIGTGLNGTANTVLIQPDQKIVVGGTFTLYSGSTSNYIARINPNGTIDTGSSWNIGTGFNTTPVNSVVIQSDGKIVAGGAFTTYSGSGATRIVRINTSGSIDTAPSWNPGTSFNGTVNIVAIEPGTGKIMVGGGFTSYSGSLVNRIARLNTNGTLDNTFNPISGGFNTTVNTIVPY